jgi:hypothetical protein
VEEARKRALASGHSIAKPEQYAKRCAGQADAVDMKVRPQD